MNLDQFLVKYPKENIPFWPHACETTPFALRTDPDIIALESCSPIHTGRDRSRGEGNLIAPFNGTFTFERVGAVVGTLGTFESSEFNIALQWYHSKLTSRSRDNPYKQGDILPCKPSNQSSIQLKEHVHLEGLLECTKENLDILKDLTTVTIYKGGNLNIEYLMGWAKKYKLNQSTFITKVRNQLNSESWGITELTDAYCIRDNFPTYRKPSWGLGKQQMLVFNTKKLLDV